MDSNFINNIIPRLRAFTRSIEIREALVDKIWEIYDDPDNLHDYQFLRDQRLIMTYNGDVKFGEWEILPGRRLLIKRGNDNPINLLYDFSIYGVVLMKKAGNNQTPFLLYDKKVIPDGNIIRYLVDLESKRIIPPQSPGSNVSPYDQYDLYLGTKYTIITIVVIITLILLYVNYG